jgi:hypothetical protein
VYKILELLFMGHLPLDKCISHLAFPANIEINIEKLLLLRKTFIDSAQIKRNS